MFNLEDYETVEERLVKFMEGSPRWDALTSHRVP
jgi:hypothetical protein